MTLSPYLTSTAAVDVVYSAVPIKTSGLVALYIESRRPTLASQTIRTLHYNLGLVARQMGDPPSSQVRREHVEMWMGAAKLAPSTLRTRLSQVRGLSAWAVERRYFRVDPTLGVRGPRQPRRLPRGLQIAESRALVAAAPDDRTRLVLLLMLQEGLRRAEVARLSTGDIDPLERTMRVLGKGDNERILPISDETWAALQTYVGGGRMVAGPLIRSLSDGLSGITPPTVGRMVSAVMLAASVKRRAYDGRSGHSCRHTAATDALKAGAHLVDVKNMLGHLTLRSTEPYLPLLVRDLRSAMGGRRYGVVPT